MQISISAVLKLSLLQRLGWLHLLADQGHSAAWASIRVIGLACASNFHYLLACLGLRHSAVSVPVSALGMYTWMIPILQPMALWQSFAAHA